MLQISLDPFPYLQSERLAFRPVNVADVEEVYSLRSDEQIMRYIPRPLAKTKQDAIDHIELISKQTAENTLLNWAITFKGENKLIGMICLIRMQPENYRTEVGYILHPDFQGKGIMNEALQVVIDYAFNGLNFHSLEAVIDPENSSSENLLIRNRFVKEAHFKENQFYNERFSDTVVYSLLNKNGKDLESRALFP